MIQINMKYPKIIKNCPVCGVEFETSNAKKAAKTCGSPICSKVRILSDESKQKIAAKLRVENPKRSSVKRTFTKTFVVPEPVEIKFIEYTPKLFIEKLSELYKIQGYEDGVLLIDHGIFVAFNLSSSREEYCTTNKYDYLPVLFNFENIPSNCVDNELYFIAEFIKHKNGELTPFYFWYDTNRFLREYENLVYSRSAGNKHIYCINMMEYFHKHMFFMKTEGNKRNPTVIWNDKKQTIIDNRIKHADTRPRSLRRYFKLGYMCPNLFPDLFARNMASAIKGNVIVDPFSGFGGRMLGVCSCGKTYIGNDLNVVSVNANVNMKKLLGIDAVLTYGDSKQVKLGGDGMITSPPYFNLDDYGHDRFKSVDQYLNDMNEIFKNCNCSNAIIDIKEMNGCSISKFKECLPWKNVEEKEVIFGHTIRKSTHLLLVCSGLN